MGEASSDDILEGFLERVEAMGLALYPAQEEAILELYGGSHVILNTPTGSGKSLVAQAVHHRALALGRRSYYTSPIKALVSEKFFDLCRTFGADNVGMTTGDASINPTAPIICCTAEVLANIALREWGNAAVDDVVMDEFHYFADRDRGMAWQVPLLTLPRAQFLLMSATLGDTTIFEREIEERTGTAVATVRSDDRPVPLDYSYSESPLHETIADLLQESKSPVYLVNFTQRECAEQAQNLTSVNVCTKEEKQEIQAAIGKFRFDSPAGREIKRFLHHGIGIHHAGLLPKYRLLVEKLSQQGLLKVISGTDTLGVGINIPIRTVLFTKLCKFDGRKTGIMKVRDFKQIAGRAGRKGYDTAGSVVVQAPEHVIENRRAEQKASADGKRKRKIVRKKPPERGYAHWDASTFERLVTSDPEPLESRFRMTHGLMVNCLDRDVAHGRRDGGYRRIVELIERSYESGGRKSRHRRHAAVLFRSLREAKVVELVAVDWARGPAVRVAAGLQREFSLFHALSLYLIEALFALDPEHETYALDVVSLTEAILESPGVILRAQLSKARDNAMAEMKAAGLEYAERMEKLDEVTPPRPCADLIEQTFEIFRHDRPWVGGESVEPKSIARELYEQYLTFNQYVGMYGLARSEGVLFRYLGQAYKALIHTVPDRYKTDEVRDVEAFLRATLLRVDESLVREWETMVGEEEVAAEEVVDPETERRTFLARVRAELHRLVKALAEEDWDEALAIIEPDEDDPWTAERLKGELAGFCEEHEALRFRHEARFHHLTRLRSDPARGPVAEQMLVGSQGPTDWFLEADVRDRDGWPRLVLRRIAI